MAILSQNFSVSNDLYLVAFLATLLLLSVVSTVIFTRAYVHRRDLRAANERDLMGLFYDNRVRQRRDKRRTLTKPLLYNVCVVKLECDDHDRPRWNQLIPIAVQPMQAKIRQRRKGTPCCEQNVDVDTDTPPDSPQTPSTPSQHRLSLFGTMNDCIMHSTKAPVQRLGLKEDATPLDLLQVSVLVQLPTSTRGPGDELPNLMLGIAYKNLTA